jgi:acetyl esterase/lipase
MKKLLLTITSFFLIASAAFSQRYLTEIFPSASVTPDVIYANNISVLTGTPTAMDIKMDIYEPAGMPDPLAERPLIIYLHTGSFLPLIINQTTTGSKIDSAAREICTQLARRGYVAASIDYRLGWNPAALGPPGQDIRTGTLLQAVYRAIQDLKACVRYFKADAAGSNTYGIDTSNIILGGQGTGGYIALAYMFLDDTLEYYLPKFTAATTNAQYGFVAGQPYINQSLMGDLDGYGGIPLLNNPNNTPGMTHTVHFGFNLGGALGDSSWVEGGEPPVVAFHVVGDPFAPYACGPVIVPTTGDFVVDVCGSSDLIPRTTAAGNNTYTTAGFTDPYTLAANMNNGGNDGLYGFVTNPLTQAGPWEWWDSTTVVNIAVALGMTAAQGTQIHQNSLLTNPDMSKAKALAYIDTIMNYVNPRIVYSLGLPTGIEQINILQNSISVYPNPAGEIVYVELKNIPEQMEGIKVYDVMGNLVKEIQNVKTTSIVLNRAELDPGMYVLKIKAGKGEVQKKLVLR